MLHITPQERLALSVTALLIAAGTGVRVMGREPPPVEWTAPADTLTDGGLARLRTQVEQQTAERRVAAEPLRPGERIDPNRATAPELERLPRVGPSLAARIVEYRQANGSFRTTGDLDVVPGVGPALLEGITPHVTLIPGPATAARASAGSPSGAATESSAKSGVGEAAPDRPLDLNRATAEELQQLPGIGPALARRIVDWRAENGRFRTLEALEEVPGIGPAVRSRIAPLVRIDP